MKPAGKITLQKLFLFILITFDFYGAFNILWGISFG